jgi:hypothetical protein
MSDQEIKKPNPLANYFRQPKLYIKLPSQGRFYPEGSLDASEIGEYAVYAMTAKDELMLKTPDALMNGQATTEVIKSCFPAIKNPWSMPSIDLDTVLIAIRIATYGENMEFNSTCPSCGHFNDLIFNLLGYLDQSSEFDYENEIDISPLKVYIRPYSYKEVTQTNIKTLQQQKIIDIVNDETMSEEEKLEKFGESFVKLTQLTVDVIAGCIERIETPEGVVDDQNLIKDFIENSDKSTFNAINERIIELKDKIALKSQSTKCQECEHEYSIDITMDQANFFAVGP